MFLSNTNNQWLFIKTTLATCFVLVAGSLLAEAKHTVDPNKAYNFILSDNRICEDCTWRWVAPELIELTNKSGISANYSTREILGVNVHPFRRWLYKKHLDGIWLSGKVIVPQATDDRHFLEFPPPPNRTQNPLPAKRL